MEMIIKKASELFFSYGVKSISMEDVARSTGTSKKTLYQTVADKNELVNKVVDEFILYQIQVNKQAGTTPKNAIDEVFKRSTISFSALASVNFSFFYDLEKFFPAGWKKMTAYKHTIMLPCIIQNLERGIKEGLYRADLDIPFIANIRLQQITAALNPLPSDKNKGVQKIMNALTEFYLYSITNTRGRQLIKKLKTKNENQ
jgi:AcrR family transcriptional regulator